MRLNYVIAALAFAAAAAPALAQQPAAGAATTGTVPKHNCTKPGEFPGNLASDGQQRQFQRDYVAYTDCLKKFVDEQNKLAEPHIKASNETVNEYNAAVKAFNEYAEATKERAKNK